MRGHIIVDWIFDEDVMFKPTLVALGIITMLGSTLPALAAQDVTAKDEQIQQLRDEIRQLRQDYDAVTVPL